MKKDIAQHEMTNSYATYAKIVANKKCKNCYGRGYVIYDLGKYTPIRHRFCGCTQKGLKSK